MGREVRRVPADWSHPKNDDGKFTPMYGGSFAKSLAKWSEGNAKWAEGLRDDHNGGWKPRDADDGPMTFEEWEGARPVFEDYMPEFDSGTATHFMMYEDTTEGTPISPAFSTPEELARWLADSGASSFGSMTATYNQWLATCRSGFAMSMVIAGGRFMSGVEAMAELDAE